MHAQAGVAFLGTAVVGMSDAAECGRRQGERQKELLHGAHEGLA